MNFQLQQKKTFLLLMTGIASIFYAQAQNVVLNFSNMNPHVGQKLEARLIDKSTLKEVDRVTLDEITTPAFSLILSGEEGKSYYVDFYADLNKNGRYDTPPTDHAWRLEANNLIYGDNMLDFIHNTAFTDIKWKGMLTMEFKNMNPHVGQRLEIRVRDVNQIGREVGRVSLGITTPEFDVKLPFLQDGRTYMLDFYADLNKNGHYDAPPTDHAWRMMVENVEGDEDVTFTHNTTFTDIGVSNLLKVHFVNMNPHIGQLLELRVIAESDGSEVERARQIITVPDFFVEIPGITPNDHYQIDFYADLNKNGLYDVPPTDHAWRMILDNHPLGDTTLTFTHNTSFTNVNWVYQMTLATTNMTPHLGQKFELKVINTNGNAVVGSFSLPAIQVPFFFMRVPGLKYGDNYNADFYADFNNNGSYDAPPVDHAWRVNFDDDEGDELVLFNHNTNFTDIQFGTTGIQEISGLQALMAYPNPFDDSFALSFILQKSTPLSVMLYNSVGQEVQVWLQGVVPAGSNNIHLNGLQHLAPGIYLVKLQNDEGGFITARLVKR